MAEYWTDLGINNYKILQDDEAYAFSQDSVFLANMAKLGSKDAVLDLGCGSGILSFIALAKKGVKSATGLEISQKFCDMATLSANANSLPLEIICGDVKDIRNLVSAESFDKVLCNPPYFAPSSPISQKAAVARTESTATLDDFVSAASYALKFGGDLWIVIKAPRFAALIVSCAKYGLAPKEATLIYPKLLHGVDSVVLSAKKGGKEGLVLKTFIAQNEDNSFTDEYQSLYR